MYWILEAIQLVAVILLFILVIKESRENFKKGKEIAALQSELDSIKYDTARNEFLSTSKMNHCLDLLLTTLNNINKNYRVTNTSRMNLMIFMARFIDTIDIKHKDALKINTNKFTTYKSGTEPLYNYINKSLYFENLSDEQISEILSAIYYLVTK